MFKKNQISAVLAALLLAAGTMGVPVYAEDTAQEEVQDTAGEVSFAGGSGTAEDPWQIADKEQLLAVADQLDGHYILTADIDFAGENIEPIGAYVPQGGEGEEAELPTVEYAFSGTFDGGGHTVSNYVIDWTGEETGIGLFGCVTGEDIAVENLTVENVSVTSAGSGVGAVIGLQAAPVSGIHLEGENTVTAFSLVGGVIGGAMADVTDCTATADIVMTGENAQGAGILIGGQEDGNVENCQVSGGTVSAESTGAFSVGGFAGCFQESEYVKNCSVADVTVTTGENAVMVGALSGHAGCGGDNSTLIQDCTVENVTLETGEGSERIGGISGSGFYIAAYAEYYPEPCAIQITDCTVEGLEITGGTLAGSVLGYAYNNSTVENCTAEAMWNGEALDAQIGGDDSVAVSELK